jgi:hypothetical protein
LTTTPLSSARPRCEEVDVRDDAYADDGDVGLDAKAASGFDVLESVVAAEARDLVLEQDVDTVLAVEREQFVAQLARAELVEQAVTHVDQGDREAELAQRGGYLHADEATADDDGALGGVRRVADAVGVMERAQRVNAGEIGTGHLEAPRRRAGREQQFAVCEVAAVGRDRARADVDRGDRRLEQHLDVVVAVKSLVLDKRRAGLSAQVAL